MCHVYRWTGQHSFPTRPPFYFSIPLLIQLQRVRSIHLVGQNKCFKIISNNAVLICTDLKVKHN